jgi:DNA-directed RNA polymerase specialized sigma24 family protein
MPDDEVRFLTGRMVSFCLFAGLAHQDAEDLVQDVWAWLLASGKVAMIALAPWRVEVLRNFLRRYLRRRWRESRFESMEDRDSGHPAPFSCQPSAAESRLYLDRLASKCRPSDRRLLELMGAGYRLAEATRAIGIAHGSQQFHLKRIRELARRLEGAATPRCLSGSTSGSRRSVLSRAHPRRLTAGPQPPAPLSPAPSRFSGRPPSSP